MFLWVRRFLSLNYDEDLPIQFRSCLDRLQLFWLHRSETTDSVTLSTQVFSLKVLRFVPVKEEIAYNSLEISVLQIEFISKLHSLQVSLQFTVNISSWFGHQFSKFNLFIFFRHHHPSTPRSWHHHLPDQQSSALFI